MTTLRQTLEQARDALKAHCGGRCNAEYNPCADLEIADSLTAALAQLDEVPGIGPVPSNQQDNRFYREKSTEQTHSTELPGMWDTSDFTGGATDMPAPSTEGEQEALPMDTAPTDGTMIRLLVDFEGNSLEDTDQPVWTIGACYASDSQGDVWQFAGWNWSHDCFTEGHGKPIGWLPMLGAKSPILQIAMTQQNLSATHLISQRTPSNL